MKFPKFFIPLLLIGLFLEYKSTSSAAEYTLTPAQKHFTAIIKSLPGVVDLEWRSPISLWIQASSKAVGSPPSPEKAKNLADILAERGRTALRQPFCVHIYHQKGKELARTCTHD